MIDVSLLKSLFEDDQMIRKFLSVFKADVPITLADLRARIISHDWEHASIVAHSLKSQLQYLKEDEASNVAFNIEKICDPTNPPDEENVYNKFEILEKYIKGVFRKIDAY